MPTRESGREPAGHAIQVVERRHVEEYAAGTLRSADIANLVEDALLEDDAAREVVRGKLCDDNTPRRSPQTQGRLFEALQDLHTAVHSCEAFSEMYDDLARHTDNGLVRHFLDSRRDAFGRAAEELQGPLKDQPSGVPDTWPEETVLLASESRESLIKGLREEPARALAALDEMHGPLMTSLRTLVHLPWPLETKLMIAETYAMLREEVEAGAWHMERKLRA